MTMTTRVLSVSIPVRDLDAARDFYRDVLGCEVVRDLEVWPGARMVEVVPPGSSVALVLLPPDGPIPVAVRLGTSDAQAALDRVREAGADVRGDGLVHLPGVPPMFAFADPEGNGLVYLQDA